jgi:hypothetical protein
MAIAHLISLQNIHQCQANLYITYPHIISPLTLKVETSLVCLRDQEEVVELGWRRGSF